jgi:myosin-7
LDEEATGESVLNSGWCNGTLERTGEKGDFPAEAVYVLPSLNKPPDDILVIVLLFLMVIIYVALF